MPKKLVYPCSQGINAASGGSAGRISGFIGTVASNGLVWRKAYGREALDGTYATSIDSSRLADLAKKRYKADETDIPVPLQNYSHGV